MTDHSKSDVSKLVSVAAMQKLGAVASLTPHMENE